MLPDFPLAVPGFVPARCVLARDVPACVFFFGFPGGMSADDVPPDLRLAKEQAVSGKFDAWADGLLSRVIVAPRLTPELVQRLGAARSPLVWGYLSAIGWLGEGDEQFVALDSAGELLVVDRAEPEDPRQRVYERLRWFVAPPPSSVRDQIQRLSEHAGMLPSAVWQIPISEYVWSWRAICDEVPSAVKGGGGRR